MAGATAAKAQDDHAPQLWARIEAHAFDRPGTSLPFSKRLARDNHWSDDYARRVVDEYRRFCFLACVADHPVTPSDQVDQAWHLHLLYTRDYWGRFCPDVLQRPLHHGPTEGGQSEGRKYNDQYGRTKHSYLRFFGHHPPADIWPAARERFVRDTQWVRVNRDDYRLLPRLRPTLATVWHRASARLRTWVPLVLLVLSVLTSGGTALADSSAGQPVDDRPTALAEAGYNPYALAAKPFLVFFAVACLVVGGGLTFSMAKRIHQAGAGRGIGADEPDLYTTAALCGNARRVLTTGVARLVDGGNISIASDGKLTLHEPPDVHAGRFEHALYEAASQVERGGELVHKPPPELLVQAEAYRTAAESAGLLLRAEERPTLEVALAVMFPIALAAPRIVNALPAERPFGYLIGLTLLFIAVGAAATWVARDRLTEGGRQIKQRLDARARRMQSLSPTGKVEANTDELVWAAAIVGPTVLTQTVLADVAALRDPRHNGGAGCGDGGCGGGGCGGCGGCGG